jgi:ubiquinone/menaquinone biosynthesis C-methylase UbiE
MEPKAHLEPVYATNPINSVSWVEPNAARSPNSIQRTGVSKRANIIDVGGGTSVLCDDLLEAGYSNLTLLDISESALHAAQARLGARARAIAWLVGNITKLALPVHQYDIWYDRAVFHFLTAP